MHARPAPRSMADLDLVTVPSMRDGIVQGAQPKWAPAVDSS